MLDERSIPREWVARAIDGPDCTEIGDDDNNVHYINNAAPEFGGRVLRVV